jgi:hypothetical protein
MVRCCTSYISFDWVKGSFMGCIGVLNQPCMSILRVHITCKMKSHVQHISYSSPLQAITLSNNVIFHNPVVKLLLFIFQVSVTCADMHSLMSAIQVSVTTAIWRTYSTLFTFPIFMNCFAHFHITDFAGAGQPN